MDCQCAFSSEGPKASLPTAASAAPSHQHSRDCWHVQRCVQLTPNTDSTGFSFPTRFISQLHLLFGNRTFLWAGRSGLQHYVRNRFSAQTSRNHICTVNEAAFTPSLKIQVANSKELLSKKYLSWTTETETQQQRLTDVSCCIR